MRFDFTEKKESSISNSRMTIKQLLDGVKVSWIHANVIEKLSATQFIVGDATGIAIMETDQNHENHVEVGHGVKLVKPSKINEDEISMDKKFTPMKTKPKKIPEPCIERIEALRAKSKHESQRTSGDQNSFITFETIMNEYKELAIVKSALVYVTNVSRLIDGTYGKYRICKLRDTASVELSLSLYEPHVEKLEEHEVYRITKLKKVVLKSDGSVRLATTKYTKIVQGSSNEVALFANIQIAENVVEGPCIMYSNLSLYQSCPQHSLKLDVDGECVRCDAKIDPDKALSDFHCTLQIEVEEDVQPVLIFKRHVQKILKLENENMNECLEDELVGKELRVHFNTEEGGDGKIAVKVDIL